MGARLKAGASATWLSPTPMNAAASPRCPNKTPPLKSPFSPDVVVADFVAALKGYRVTSLTGDRWGGEFVREQFKNKGIRYDISERVKSGIYKELLPLMNSGRVELLDIPRLTTQLCSLERRTARGGRDSIDHAPGRVTTPRTLSRGRLFSRSAAANPWSSATNSSRE